LLLAKTLTEAQKKLVATCFRLGFEQDAKENTLVEVLKSLVCVV
jgi:hypothetical protein